MDTSRLNRLFVVMLTGLSLTVCGMEIEKVNFPDVIKVPQFSNQSSLFDGKTNTQFAVDDLNKWVTEITFKKTVLARYLRLVQGGWANTGVWSTAKEIAVTINGGKDVHFELAGNPAAWQTLDLQTDQPVKEFRLKVISCYPGDGVLGGFAEIDLTNTRPDGDLLSPLRPVIAQTTATLDNNSDLHATALELEVGPAKSSEYFIDVVAMDKSVWRARPPVNGSGKYTLMEKDFTRLEAGKGFIALRWAAVYRVQAVATTEKKPEITTFKVSWKKDNQMSFPWERDKTPIVIDGKTYYPGIFTNNCGHFGFCYEPNGLLIGNVSFNALVQDHVKDGGSIAVNFKIPEGRYDTGKTVIKGDKQTGNLINYTGLGSRQEYRDSTAAFTKDDFHVDWTSFRWRKQVPANGKTYYQELRYSILAPGIQVETDSPQLTLSLQPLDIMTSKVCPVNSPGAVVVPCGRQLKIVTANEGLNVDVIKNMSANWMLLLNGKRPEFPVLLLLQHRPDVVLWTSSGFVLERRDGVGTVALGFLPFGAVPQSENLAAQWQAKPQRIPVATINATANLLMAYAWSCKEYFSVDNNAVTIRDEIGFLSWQDDWKTSCKRFAPLPPLISYSLHKSLLPGSTVKGLIDFKLPTKWGYYQAVPGSVITYRLPFPRLWDNMPLRVDRTSENAWLYDRLLNSLSPAAMERIFGSARPDNCVPSDFPHYYSFDNSAGSYHAMNYMTADKRQKLVKMASLFMRGALLPQNYRLRVDPLSGAQYMACTSWMLPDYDINGENGGDIDYWQGMTLYGFYNQAKYGGQWPVIRASWPLIRSLLSYWESSNSWALMSPGARESGELYHGDMPTAGYAGLVGFHYLSKELGSDYQKALGDYLLARATVPMRAKFDFMDWMKLIGHHCSVNGYLCSGFGERWIASFNECDPKINDVFSNPRDPWWRTGCIGPLSSQNEIMDLYTGIRREIIPWERRFEQMSPNNAMSKFDDMRVMPHVMLRSYLAPEMLPSALDMLRKYHSTYMLRDVHIPAEILSRQVPVRLLDWSPAVPLEGEWRSSEHAAILSFDAPSAGAIIKLVVKNGAVKVGSNGNPVEIKVGRQEFDGWTPVEFVCPPGRHQFKVE